MGGIIGKKHAATPPIDHTAEQRQQDEEEVVQLKQQQQTMEDGKKPQSIADENNAGDDDAGNMSPASSDDDGDNHADDITNLPLSIASSTAASDDSDAEALYVCVSHVQSWTPDGLPIIADRPGPGGREHFEDTVDVGRDNVPDRERR